jgi:hypothetical protein
VIQLLKKKHYLKMPWANGLGLTEQIDIFPSEANVTERDFLWRLSSATIQQASTFSLFPKYDRLLMVIEGKGLILNQSPLAPFEVFSFSGDVPMDCQLTAGPVLDLGLIYSPAEIEVQAQIKLGLQSLTETFKATDVGYFYGLEGSCTVIGEQGLCLSLMKGDTLKVEGPHRLDFETAPNQVCHLIKLHLRRKKI